MPCVLVETPSVSEKLSVSNYFYPKSAGSRYLLSAIRFLPDYTSSRHRRERAQTSGIATRDSNVQLHLSGITNNKILVEYQRYGMTEMLRFQIDVIIARRRARETENETGKIWQNRPQKISLGAGHSNADDDDPVIKITLTTTPLMYCTFQEIWSFCTGNGYEYIH